MFNYNLADSAWRSTDEVLKWDRIWWPNKVTGISYAHRADMGLVPVFNTFQYPPLKYSWLSGHRREFEYCRTNGLLYSRGGLLVPSQYYLHGHVPATTWQWNISCRWFSHWNFHWWWISHLARYAMISVNSQLFLGRKPGRNKWAIKSTNTICWLVNFLRCATTLFPLGVMITHHRDTYWPTCSSWEG